MEQLRCVVERVTYSSEESGFCVLQTKVDSHKDLVTLVGSMAGIRPGSVLTVSGQWKLNSQYGRQFAVDRWEETLPADERGLEKYLGSGVIKGIGPHCAGLIVHRFGQDALRIIEEEPKRLTEISGIGAKRAEMIRQSWDSQREIRNIMIFLQSNDVGASHAAKIFKRYGAQSVKVVRENPYRLADDIRGIGFVTADRIAQKLGFDLNSYARCRSGTVYTLNLLADEGHCFAYRKQLEEAAAKLLNIDEQVVSMTLDHMLSAGDLIREGTGGEEGPPIYLPPFHHSETGVARRVRSIIGTPPLIQCAAQSDSGRRGIAYNELQRKAVLTASEAKCMVLTGGPGTGKTTTLLGILSVFSRQGLKALLAAPTGRAAKRMTETTGLEAKTIHRLLEYSPTEGYRHNDQNLIKGDALIVDEVSMIDVVLMYNLLKAVPNHMKLILVGDVDQLPSIGPGCVLRDIIASGVVPVIHLKEIFRQAGGSQIIHGAHRVNRGEMPLFSRGRDGDFFFLESKEAEETASLIVDLCVRRLPNYYHAHPIQDIQVLTPMIRGVLGAQNLNALLQKSLNPDAGEALSHAGMEYHRHDKVMQIRNNYEKEVFNGDIGYVESVNAEERVMEVLFDGRLVPYDTSELEDLMLAYACTVHKAQGSEYPIVVMPVTMKHYVMLQRNLIYTGMTRAKRVLVMAGMPAALHYAVKNNKVSRRNTLLEERLRGRSNSIPVPEGLAEQGFGAP